VAKVAHVRLCHSRMLFVRAYPRESQEMVLDAHDRAFAFFKGACTRGIYDNMKTAVDAVFVGRERAYNRRFLQMCGHYLVDPVACTPASGWEKGQVENQVGVVRQRFFAPRVRAKSYEELNACWKRRLRRRGRIQIGVDSVPMRIGATASQCTGLPAPGDLPIKFLRGIRLRHISVILNEDASLGDEIWATILSEFSDVPDVSTTVRITLRLSLAALLGGILGYERERKGRSAGVRTHMLVAVGAALFVIGPLQRGMPIEDMSRVLQGIVQGIGFLGAGAIMVRATKHQVEGLTTAANIWATAGIGVIAGLGLEATAVLSAAVVLIILAAVPVVLPKDLKRDPGPNDQ
jgi:putative Mg2+ transporter-C (MgtC) family protein